MFYKGCCRVVYGVGVFRFFGEESLVMWSYEVVEGFLVGAGISGKGLGRGVVRVYLEFRIIGRGGLSIEGVKSCIFE